MVARILTLLGLAVAVVTAAAPAFAAPPGPTVVQHGQCVVADGVKSTWDVTQEIFQTGSPTWLPAHLHAGAECIMSVSGVTAWWFAATTPGGSSTPFPIPAGKTLYTPEGQVHTAGNPGPAVPGYAQTQAYLGIHVLVHGTAFNYPVDYPSAPGPVQKTAPVSIFKNTFLGEPSTPGRFIIDNTMLGFAKDAVYQIPATRARGYYTVVTGLATATFGGRTVVLTPKATAVVPRGVPATITASKPTMLAATQLIPAIQ
jgi:mannose-6-phosphate isomerase-like protein (cupin superfamily)